MAHSNTILLFLFIQLVNIQFSKTVPYSGCIETEDGCQEIPEADVNDDIEVNDDIYDYIISFIVRFAQILFGLFIYVWFIHYYVLITYYQLTTTTKTTPRKVTSTIQKIFEQPSTNCETVNFETGTKIDYKNVFNFQSSSKQSVVFHVKNRSDAHILLKAGKREFDIVLGSRGNRISEIRDEKSETGNIISDCYTGFVCDRDVFKKFMISWSFNSIRVFRFEQNDDLTISKEGVKICEVENYEKYLIDKVPIESLSISTDKGHTGSWRFMKDNEAIKNQVSLNIG